MRVFRFYAFCNFVYPKYIPLQIGLKTYFSIPLQQKVEMASFTLTLDTWQKVKIKFLRKYRELAKEDIVFEVGKEDELVQRLMGLVKRDKTYIEFTIRKALADQKGNRL